MSDIQSTTMSRNNNSPRRKRLANRPTNYEVTFMVIVSVFAMMSVTLNLLLHDSAINTGDNPSKYHPILNRNRMNNSKKMVMQSSESHHELLPNQHTAVQEASMNLVRVETSNSSQGLMKEQEHRLGGLKCESYGGPNKKIFVNEMVYWSDIPSDSKFVSPFKTNNNAKGGAKQYMTFEPGTYYILLQWSIFFCIVQLINTSSCL
jgi:hypothetical protein